MRKLEIAYLVYLVAIVISHIYFTLSIVFGRDTVYLMETSFSWVLLIYPIANLFWFVIYYYGYLEKFSKGFHGLSLSTFFFAGFPIITSIVQGLTALNGLRIIPKQYKHIQHLNKLYRQKLEEMGQLSNWGLDTSNKGDDEEETDSLKSFLQRDIEQHGDEYVDYLTLDEEEAQEIIDNTTKLSDTKVVVGTKAYDVKEKMRREYEWLIPIYGVQVVEELSLDELMDLAVDESGYDEDDEIIDEDDEVIDEDDEVIDEDDEVIDDIRVTPSDLEMPSFLERGRPTQELEGVPTREDYSITGVDNSQTEGTLYGEVTLEELLDGKVSGDSGATLTPLKKKDGSELYLEDLL